MRVSRWIIALLAGWFATQPAAAQDVTTDPFIQEATNPDNWAPGGRFFGFNDRGTEIERSGDVTTTIVHEQNLGNFKLQNGDIRGNLRFVSNLDADHGFEVHNPFDSRSSRSASDRQNSSDGTQSSYAMEWDGVLVHPANGYDPPTGGGFPAPDPRGAIDIITFDISGIATGIFALSTAEIQQRDVADRQNELTQKQQALDNFLDAFESFTDPESAADFAGSFWSAFKGLVDTTNVGFDKLFDEAGSAATPVALEGFRALSPEAQYASLEASNLTSSAIDRATQQVVEVIGPVYQDLQVRYPEATKFVISEGGYIIAAISAGKVSLNKIIGRIDLDDVSRPTITIGDRRARHNEVVNDFRNQLDNQGYEVKTDVTFGSACGSAACRPDIIYRDPDGQVGIIEVKTGDADLTVRQSEIFPQIKDGDAIPRGELAEQFDLIPGVPLKDQGYPNGIPIVIERAEGLPK